MEGKYTALTFRLYPTEEQLRLFYRTSGSCRWLYNKCKAHKDQIYREKGKTLGKYHYLNSLPKLKEKYEWLKEVNAQSLQQSIIDLFKAYDNFFKHGFGYPKFKKYGDRRSFRLPQHCSVDIETKSLRLAKLDWCKARGNFHLYNEEPVQSITVSQDSDGKWYASVLIKKDTAVYDHVHRYESCGIDLGVTKPLTICYENNSEELKHRFGGVKFSRELEKKELRRKKYQKQYSRKQKGSKNQEKARKKVAKASYREKEYRKNFVEQTSVRLASLFHTVIFEDLRIKNMTASAKGTVKEPGSNVKQKSGLNREMLRLGHGMLVQRTEQKANRYEGNVLFVNPKFTSQECRECGYTSKENRNGSIFLCLRCSHEEHADVNAGFNIHKRGKLLKEAA